jgi:hypothetical protein
MRIKSLDSLQPEFRAKVEHMLALLAGSKYNWQIFEARRPITSSCGVANPAISKTDPCVNPTKHAYGAAVDVLPNGSWNGPWKSAAWPGWSELRAAAHQAGLENDIAWDRTHVEVPRSDLVRWLQSDLAVTVDGKWGPETDAAARARAAELNVEWATPIPKSPPINWVTYQAIRDGQVIEKSQLIRLLDVWALGPALVYVGTRQRRRLYRNFLYAAGLATIIYNARNYLANK